MVQYFPVTYEHSPIYFKSSLDYLYHLIQSTCHVNSCEYNINAMKIVCQHAVDASFAFLELPGFFSNTLKKCFGV